MSDSGHTSPAPVDHAEGWQRKTLPLELVEQIFDLFFLEAKTFEDIRPFSMASTQFRTIVLRRYMSTLRICSKKQLISHTLMHYSVTFRSSPHVYAGFDWVKHLFVVPEALTTSRWKPDLFWDLRSLHISLADSGSRTQGSILNRISGKPTFATVASRLSSLTITSLWRIGVDLLSMVARIFPALTDLHLSSSENLDTSCCWLCYEESSAAVTHSPIPGHYANVRTLSTAFAEALSPLTKLVHLHLGIFLSDEDMVDAHIDHYDSPREYEHALLVYAAEKRPDEPVTTLKSSPRDRMGSLKRVSHTEQTGRIWRTSWTTGVTERSFLFHMVQAIARSVPFSCQLSQVRARELEASLAIARKLRSVKTISWSSFFPSKLCTTAHASAGDGKTTTTYVLRANGRVRVRRRPWD
ncbi:hypothetical protein F5J12DRAFT_781878 [Pisolithus orientalis]|uniref:uncharacterized protein n=1 Tax=Pisolithus orientalis TaxID=936130 RepID=UPI0022251347|nr:uncharacterized protein F5J12DRAFT_781878 [Pisolithus orientalis]KAI6010912.1 hypothetical protein F5J12DRAFT_781878 [Pisolithus orientalis]